MLVMAWVKWKWFERRGGVVLVLSVVVYITAAWQRDEETVGTSLSWRGEFWD